MTIQPHAANDRTRSQESTRLQPHRGAWCVVRRGLSYALTDAAAGAV